MLITLCYSVLTWMQSRQRTEIVGWIQECLVKEKGSVVFIRDRILLASPRKGASPTLDTLLDQSILSQSSSGYGLSSLVNRSESFSSSVGGDPLSNSPSRNLSRSSSNVSGGSNYSTPRKENSGTISATGATAAVAATPNQYDGETHLAVVSKSSRSGSNNSSAYYGSIRQISDLCYNHSTVRLRRLLWEEDRARAIVLMPQQIVDLHDWTAFVDSEAEISSQVDVKKFYILFEAEPGLTHRLYYRKFTQFGRIVSWKCGPSDLALILYSDLNQLIELMHIFRLGQIILEGGWRVYRLTTISIEGTIGTLISRGELAGKTSLTPADLRRLSAGLYESRTYTNESSAATSVTGTPKTFVSVSDSQDISKHDITTIDEEALEDSELDLTVKLPNWYDRSPRKRSVANLNFTEKTPVHQVPRRKSFCPGSLGSLPHKSGSLASLLMCAKSLSLDEDEPPSSRRNTESESKYRTLPPNSLRTSGAPARSVDSLTKTSSKTPSSSGTGTPSHLLSPMTNQDKSVGSPAGMLSTLASPRRLTPRKSPKRIGKPPNILILCENETRRAEIGVVLKAMLANDRYAIYDIRWDQLGVGGWSEQTALLVLAGKIPDKKGVSVLLQFLGDGGRLLSWCCENAPFGPEPAENASTTTSSTQKKIIQHGPAQKVTHALAVSDRLWGAAAGDHHPPPGFQRVLETSDSEGYSRPMTVSAYGKVKDTNQTCIVQLDGGALGGKAILSQIHFEKCVDENDSLALLSLLLSQNLGIDCTQIKAPEYTLGFLLGDYKKIVDFLTSNPSTIQQADLTVEFIPRGEKGSLPSHLRFPIRILECPSNFSTVEYYDNLSTKELGRLVIYTDVITSTMNVIHGHFLGHGLVVIAARQTTGRGRGKNVWLSPEGCACFSIQLSINLDSAMGRRISLIQHIAGLAIVQSIPYHKELGICVKWPNDIYVNDTKIGGILVESQIEGRKAIVNIGVGINVTNAYPTTSLNSVLQENASILTSSVPQSSTASYSKGNKKDKLIFSIEKVIARALSEFETLLELVEGNSIDKVITSYTDNWIHGSVDDDSDDNIVNVEVSGGNFAECRIIGIDQFGFLRVKETGSGHVFSVRPDGNSFDIANKLIAIKD